MQNKILVGLFVILLLISGCTSFSRTSNVETIEDYRVGTKGIDISFLSGLPSKELIEDSQFSVGITLHNRGATSVENGRITLSYDDEYLGFTTDTNKNFELEGRSQFLPDGEERSFYFEGSTQFLDRESFRRDVTITATACYPYETSFIEFVCLDRPYVNDQERGNAVCRVQDVTSSGQGGPVYVSSVDMSFTENSQGVKPFFDITISHRGSGLVIHPHSYDSQCSRASSQGQLNKVLVTSVTLSEVQLDCNERELTLRDGSARLRCSTVSELIASRLPFESPLRIELSYGYAESESFKTTIVR